MQLIKPFGEFFSFTDFHHAHSVSTWLHIVDIFVRIHLKANEIKLRHYSPSTLKTYTGWVRQIQAFVKSKGPRLLDNSDVKAFLTHLAVKRKVAASTGYGGAFLPNRLEIKYKHAARELVWQWFFPAKMLTFVADKNEYRRYHLHKTHVRKAIKQAVGKAKIPKRASAHTFRHSFAGHLLQVNYDIRTL